MLVKLLKKNHGRQITCKMRLRNSRITLFRPNGDGFSGEMCGVLGAKRNQNAIYTHDHMKLLVYRTVECVYFFSHLAMFEFSSTGRVMRGWKYAYGGKFLFRTQAIPFPKQQKKPSAISCGAFAFSKGDVGIHFLRFLLFFFLSPIPAGFC